MANTSSDTQDKLHAVITQRARNDDSAQDYRSACWNWFANLSDVQKALTDAAMIVYGSGDKAGAAQMLANLPTAPKHPISQ